MSLILLYVDSERFWRGGQQQLFDLMTGIAQRGHRVRLAAPAEGPLAARSAAAGIEVLPLSQGGQLSVTAWWRLRGMLRRCQPDVVHCNTPRVIPAAGLAARGLPTVAVASRRVVFPLKTRFSQLPYNRLIDCTATVADCIRRQLVTDGVDPARVEVIYEGVDPGALDAQPAGRLALAGSGPVIGVVAAMTREKGHHTFLQAVALLRSEGLRLRALLIGDGPLRAELEQWCRSEELEEVVHFAGFRDDVVPLLKGIDVFCLPSLSEGLSSSILEAMGVGLPVVASRVGGTPELVLDEVTGLLVSPGDAARLAAALRDLVESRPRRESLGAAGRRRVEERFTRRHKLEATEDLYRRLLAEARIR